MKVQNKETGGLANLIVDKDLLRVKTDAGWADYNSLAELNEEWEDYEEPKEYWYLDLDGEINNDADVFENKTVRDMKQIGNYFATREEAERAVEKLKAWKRLKDEGFRFVSWNFEEEQMEIKLGHYLELRAICTGGIWQNDLDLLFGDSDA